MTARRTIRTQAADVALGTLALAAAQPGQPARSFDALAKLLLRYPGYLLFSVSALERGTILRRIYSTDQARHPLGATKDMAGTGYCATLIQKRQHVLSQGAIGLQATFQGHEAMLADGIGCALNLCLQYDGKVVGSANILGRGNAYDTHTADHLDPLVLPLSLLVALEAIH